jgi:hypothetical protein
VLKLMLGLGADKGLHGAGMFDSQPDSIVSGRRSVIWPTFKGKKIRIFASDFQSVALQAAWRDAGGDDARRRAAGDPARRHRRRRSPASPCSTLSIIRTRRNTSPRPISRMIFLMVEISRNGTTPCRPICSKPSTRTAAESTVINPMAIDFRNKARKSWTDNGGELISLPRDEQAQMLQTLASVGEDVSKSKPRSARPTKSSPTPRSERGRRRANDLKARVRGVRQVR